MAERGRCGCCGDVFALTAKRVIRSHRSGHAEMEPVYSDGRYLYHRSGVCPGAGMPAVGPDEPLHRTQLADARRELAAQEQELARLRHYAAALEHERNAWKARCEALGHIRDANKALLDALRSMMGGGDRYDADSELFAAKMEALRVEYPVLREGAR